MEIYQIVGLSGRYLNVGSKVPFFTEVFWRGSYFSSEQKALTVISQLKRGDLLVEKTTEKDYTEAIASETTNVSIQMDSLATRLERIAYNLPTMSGLNKSLKNFLLNTSVKLKKANPQFNEFLEVKEDATYDVQGVYDEYINNLSKLDLWELNDFNQVLAAFKKDKSSLLGIAKKINRHGNK